MLKRMRLAFFKRPSTIVLVAVALLLAMLHGAKLFYSQCYLPHVAEWKRLTLARQREDAIRFVEARRQAVYAQTMQLPPVDRIDVFLLGHYGEEVRQGFPIRPCNVSAVILGSKRLTDNDAEALAQLWRSRKFGGQGFLCHEPAYGLRFFSGETLLCETSLCWMCANCYVFDGRSEYGWLGFVDAHGELLDFLKTIIPLPKERSRSPL